MLWWLVSGVYWYMYEYDRATERIFTLSNPYLPDQDMYLHRPEVSWASVFSLQNERKINSDSLAEYFYSGKTVQDDGDIWRTLRNIWLPESILKTRKSIGGNSRKKVKKFNIRNTVFDLSLTASKKKQWAAKNFCFYSEQSFLYKKETILG